MAKQDWHDPQVAADWNGYHPLKNQGNPSRAEHLDILVSIIQDHYTPGKMILDLGAGNGIVEEMLFKASPDTRITGIDYSEPMIALSRQRLAAYAQQYTIIQHDLSQLSTLSLPSASYQIAFSVQTLHHLSAEAMQACYQFIYQILEPDGLFLLMDRVQIDQAKLWSVYRSLWKREMRVYHADPFKVEGATLPQHQRWLTERGDYPQSASKMLEWLQAVGFEAAPMDLRGHRALIAARK
jgi:tRNA (cmo5U34)-methyltransferase